MHVYKTYSDADDAAAQMITSSGARMIFISVNPWGLYELSTNSIALNYPRKRYLRLSNGAVRVNEVSTWRRN